MAIRLVASSGASASFTSSRYSPDVRSVDAVQDSSIPAALMSRIYSHGPRPRFPPPGDNRRPDPTPATRRRPGFRWLAVAPRSGRRGTRRRSHWSPLPPYRCAGLDPDHSATVMLNVQPKLKRSCRGSALGSVIVLHAIDEVVFATSEARGGVAKGACRGDK